MGSLASRLLAKARVEEVDVDGIKVLVRQPSALQSLELSRFAKDENVDFVKLLIDQREMVCRLVRDCVRDPEQPEVLALETQEVELLSNDAFIPILQAIVKLIQTPGVEEVKP